MTENTKNPVKIKVDINFFKAKYFIFFCAVATGVTGAILTIYAYQKFIQDNALSFPIIEGRQNLTGKDIQDILNTVSKIAVLPIEENPQLLRITDSTQLKSNPFFVDAKLKDIIIIYPKAHKIIVYDPQKNRIVNMGPYNTETAKKEASNEAKPQATQSANPAGQDVQINTR